MNKYYVTYTSSTDHDCTTVWCNADTPEKAADYVMTDWDVEDIISISRIN